MPAPDGPQFRFHLYHGTSSNAIPSIQKSGLGKEGSFLTKDPEIAEYYADAAVDELGGSPKVLKVAVRPRDLSVDNPSFEEPLSNVGEKDYEYDWDKVRNNNDWANSLRQTGTAYHSGVIPPKHIIDFDK